MKSNNTKAHFALFFTNLFFAINYAAIKYLTNHDLAKPFGLNLVRVLSTTLLLWLIFMIKPVKIGLKKKDLPRFILCALTGIVINQLLFLKGLSLTHAIHGALLMLSTPIIITFTASWLLKEKLNIYKIVGLILGLSGAMVLILSGHKTDNGPTVILGDVLFFLNAVSYSFYFILVKPLMKHYDPVNILRIIFLIGLIIMLPICWIEFSEIPWHNYNAIAFTNIGLLVIGGTFINYMLNIYGIKILGASMAGTYIYSQPFMATAIAMIFMGEKLDAYKIFAGVLIFIGVYIANRKLQLKDPLL